MLIEKSIMSVLSWERNMEISVNELSQIVLTAYDQGRRSVKDKEVKGEILEYMGRVIYDVDDLVECIVNRIEQFADAEPPYITKYDGLSEKDKTVYEIAKRIKYEFLTPLRPPISVQ